MDDDVINQIRNEMAEEGEERTPDQVRRWIGQQCLQIGGWLHEMTSDDPDLVRKLLEPTTLDEKRRLVAEMADQGHEISIEFIDQLRDIFYTLTAIFADDGDEDAGTYAEDP